LSLELYGTRKISPNNNCEHSQSTPRSKSKTVNLLCCKQIY
jgi:hypothetical protein